MIQLQIHNHVIGGLKLISTISDHASHLCPCILYYMLLCHLNVKWSIQY